MALLLSLFRRGARVAVRRTVVATSVKGPGGDGFPLLHSVPSVTADILLTSSCISDGQVSRLRPSASPAS